LIQANNIVANDYPGGSKLTML